MHSCRSSPWKTPCRNGFCTPLCGKQSSSGTLAAWHIVLSCAVSSPKVRGNNESSTTVTPEDNQTFLPMPICLHHVVAHKPGYASLVWGRGRGVLSPWCLGDRPRGPVVCLQVLPHVTAGELRLRCRLVSLMSGKLRYTRSMQASCLGSPWQSLRSTDFPDCWSADPPVLPSFDIPVLWCRDHWRPLCQGLRAMGDEPTMPDDRTPICGRQNADHAEHWRFSGTYPWPELHQ